MQFRHLTGMMPGYFNDELYKMQTERHLKYEKKIPFSNIVAVSGCCRSAAVKKSNI